MRINESQENIVALSDIREKKLRALSPFGPVRAGLTTWPDQETPKEDPLVQLLELLNSLESAVESLNYKSFTAYATLALATENLRAALYDTVTQEDGTSMATCTRCGEKVDEDELATYGDWKLCDICQEDI